MRNTPKATVIVLNWNGVRFLKQNISSVLNQTYKNYDVLVVDNGSSDNSVEFLDNLKANNKKLKAIELPENVGYVGGNNEGIKYVLEKGESEYAVILNNDMRVDENWLEALIGGFSDKSIGICTSKVMFYYPFQQVVLVPSKDLLVSSVRIDTLSFHTLEFSNGFKEKGDWLELPKKLKEGEIYNFAIPYKSSGERKGRLKIDFDNGEIKVFSGEEKKQIRGEQSLEIELDGKYIINNAGGDFIKKRKNFEERGIFEYDKDLKDEIVDTGYGGAMAIRTDLLGKMGMFNPKYFMYFEDTEISYRYGRQGFGTKFVNSALCYHYVMGSTKGEFSELQIKYGFRNRLWFIRKYFGLFSFLYYYLRTFLKFLMWALNLPVNKKAKKYLSGYMFVLKESIKSYE